MNVVLNTNLRNSSTFSIEDAQKAIQFKQVATPNYRYIVHRLMGFSPDEYTDMEYDLSESSRILDTEAFVAETFRKKRQLIVKNGFILEGKDTRNLKYIKKRLEDFEFVTQQTFRDFVSEVVENMVNYNNCFILKYRKEESSSGQIRSIPSGKEFKPIAGLYVLSAPTIDTANDSKSGKILKYRHRITENFSRQFRPSDIYHVFENRRTGMTIGTPPLEAVRDDILTLRSIEQYTEDMIRKNASPFIHVKVGTDSQPARLLGDGSSEVDIYSSIIDNMDYTGGVATPHRVEIDYKGSESRALRLESYLAYFKARVLAGLSVSEADLGGAQGGNGVFESLREDVRAYQDTISHFITNYILTELLLESPQYSNKFSVPNDEKVVFKFLEADEDRRIKLESHALNLYVSGLISKEAAIKGTIYENSDLQPDEIVEEQSINKNNSVKATISNNVLEPKNQYTSNTTIKDKLIFDDYFDIDYVIFKDNIENAFPYFDNFERYVKQLHKKAQVMKEQHDSNYVNQFIETAMLSVIQKDSIL